VKETVMSATDLGGCSVRELAVRAVEDWGNPAPAAKPYLAAMLMLETLGDDYGLEPGHDVVNRFLCNAATWKGPVARAVKAELKRRLAAQFH
jgi:hypothetical protein